MTARWLTFCSFACALALALRPAQGFPERPVRIVVPLTPGGSPDTIARAIAQGLQGVWSAAGGGREPARAEARTSAPTWSRKVLPTATPGSSRPDNVFSVNPYLTKPPFDPLADLAPVTQVARIAFLLVVPSALPVGSVQELISYAKAHPGELNYGSSGNGSPQHLGAVMFQSLTGTKMNHVPYKGAAPAMADLLPRSHPGLDRRANTLLPHIKDGKLKLLGSTAPQRFASLPGTPTIAEAGVPGYALDPWLGLFVPAKVPVGHREPDQRRGGEDPRRAGAQGAARARKASSS